MQDDLISRQAVINTLYEMDKVLNVDRTVEMYRDLLKECYTVLPSVNPQKIGHWIRVDDTKMKCSNCDIIHLIAQYPRIGIKYCPNCGAKMVEPQESEE